MVWYGDVQLFRCVHNSYFRANKTNVLEMPPATDSSLILFHRLVLTWGVLDSLIS